MSAPSASAQTPLLLQLREFIWNSVIRVLWLCGYATVTAAGTAYLFIGNDQGRDLLRLATEQPWSRTNLFFLVGAALLGLTLWYTSRLLLRRAFPLYPFPEHGPVAGRVWIPRVFGAAVPAAIGIGFLLLTTSAWLTAWILGASFLLLAVFLFWFVTRRRHIFALRQPELGLSVPATALGEANWIALSLACAGALLLLAGFLVWPVELPRLLGTPAIVMTGFAGIALFGGLVLTYAFLANGQPGGTALVLALALLFGLFNDNHWLRLTERTSSLAPQPALTRLQSWRNAHQGATPGPHQPLVLVAASGGGIRAAYWTASTLARLESIPGFADHLFAISGVSGGSVGAAVYTALERRQLDTAYAANPARPCAAGADPALLGQVREALGADFLSPVVAGLLFPDLVQRLLPFPVAAADRQRFLELGFERSLGDAPNPLSGAFLDLYAGPQGDCLPSLLLNTTSVESGQRAILSNLQVGGFSDTLDLFAAPFALQGIRLSAAAGASARFTYVSPPGGLARSADGQMEQRIVDGGYFENSGAASALDLLRLLRGPDTPHGGADPAAAQPPYPILILLRNDPRAPAVCHRASAPPPSAADAADRVASDAFLSEIAAPLRALLAARRARGRLAEVDAAREVEAMGGAVIELQLTVVPPPGARPLSAAQLAEPPLGWSLSREMRAGMDRALDEPPNRIAGEMKLLSHVLDGQTKLYVACNAY